MNTSKLAEKLLVQFVNSKADRIRALAEIISLSESERLDLVAEFKKFQHAQSGK